MANLQPQYELYCFQKLSCMQYAFRQRPGFDCRIRQKRLKPPLLTQRLIGSVVEHCPAILFLPTVVVVVVVVDRREKRNLYFFYSPPPDFYLPMMSINLVKKQKCLLESSRASHDHSSARLAMQP